MEVLDVGSKIHEEAKQGEVYSTVLDSTLTEYRKHFYIESYGCAMNFSDTEIVASILNSNGFGATKNLEEADLIFVNTCSIREKAEATVRKRLTEFRKLKEANKSVLVGVLGCMAERLKTKLLDEEKLVDIVIGPDSYRSLPSLIAQAESGQKAVNVLLSREETYADIAPIRLDSNGVSAFVSIMRGCNNMCSFCVVPFTRGRERSRDISSILQECTDLVERGYKEITLLGQNVDSYNWYNDATKHTVTFAELLEKVALVSPNLRLRFSTSHPKDITDDVLFVMAKYENICKHIHLPIQSGSSRLLQLMNRTYSREWYLSKVDRIKQILPTCTITADIITGFCTETEQDHLDTLSAMEHCQYEMSYMYYYSERGGTLAAKRFADDVPLDVKKRRLQEVVDMQGKLSTQGNLNDIGKTFKILIEGSSKKSADDWTGRSEHNKSVVFPKGNADLKVGDYVMVKILDCTRATLLGEINN